MDAALPAMEAAAPCGTCRAPMASDQRYCLECGACRTRHGANVQSDAQAQVPGRAAEIAPPPPPHLAAHAGQVRPNGTPTVIAGVGVLLLAMGVGVLIGRADAGNGRAAPAPAQVISVASPGADGAGAGASTTATGPPDTPSQTPTHKSGKHSSSGVGSSPEKPAPPSALQNLRTGGNGQSYEQKSKNLPDVVSTG